MHSNTWPHFASSAAAWQGVPTASSFNLPQGCLCSASSPVIALVCTLSAGVHDETTRCSVSACAALFKLLPVQLELPAETLCLTKTFAICRTLSSICDLTQYMNCGQAYRLMQYA